MTPPRTPDDSWPALHVRYSRPRPGGPRWGDWPAVLDPRDLAGRVLHLDAPGWEGVDLHVASVSWQDGVAWSLDLRADPATITQQ